MLLYSWDKGLDVCVDLTGLSPLPQTGMVDFVSDRAVIEAAQRLLRSCNELEEILAMVEEKRRKLLTFLIISWMQRKAQQANELSNLTRQRQLLASVNFRRAIIEELERLTGNLVACKTREHLKRIQKAVFVEVIELKKELRLQCKCSKKPLSHKSKAPSAYCSINSRAEYAIDPPKGDIYILIFALNCHCVLLGVGVSRRENREFCDKSTDPYVVEPRNLRSWSKWSVYTLVATEINNLMRQLLDIIDERRSFIGELEQRLPTNVLAYKTRQELKGLQKDDMIRAMEMRSTALQLHHQTMKGFHFYKSL
ncbi:hypothetical protein Tco_0455171 [Tanacetum coccineum]